jgi:glycosyltransferase involved in cell wall biosynthesis
MPASGKRVLQIAHNHPRLHPGGTELTALALHRQAREEGIDSWYLGALDGAQITPRRGSQMIALSPDHRESALFTDSFVRFGLEQPDQPGFVREFTDYLRAIKPNVVHFHHLLQFGLEAIHAARNMLPDVKLILTAHDFYLICANNGQLYRHDTKQRCLGPNLAECPKCFSNVDAGDLILRRQNITATLRLFDKIVAPSYFLSSKLETYLSVRQPIEFVENAYLGDAEICETTQHRSGSDPVFAYFGNISAVKGLGDLLDAAGILKAKGRAGFRIHVHGAQLIHDQSLKDRMDATKHALGSAIQFFGAYRQEDLRTQMADVDCLVFPSLWWENAPLVIYEALHHGKQVIAYPHGGAPEILRRYDVGLVAAESHPTALATEMERVLDCPSLVIGSPKRQVPGRKQLLAAYSALYLS